MHILVDNGQLKNYCIIHLKEYVINKISRQNICVPIQCQVLQQLKFQIGTPQNVMTVANPDKIDNTQYRIQRTTITNLVHILAEKVDNFMLSLMIEGIDCLLYDIKTNDKYLVNMDNNGYCHVSNKGCTICGYREKLLMRCDHCD